MKTCADKPCNECPMRRKSMPGWLGNDSPEHFIQTVHMADEMPCHKTVDYSKKNWRSQLGPDGTASACAGVAVYFANVGKVPRDRDVRRLPADKVNVFNSPVEFLTHHNSLGITSKVSDEDED